MNLILVSLLIILFNKFYLFYIDAVSDNEEEKKKEVKGFDDEDTVDADALEKKKKEDLKKK